MCQLSKSQFSLLRNFVVADMVAHTCNPAIWEAEVGGLQVQGQNGQLRTCLKIKINLKGLGM